MAANVRRLRRSMGWMRMRRVEGCGALLNPLILPSPSLTATSATRRYVHVCHHSLWAAPQYYMYRSLVGAPHCVACSEVDGAAEGASYTCSTAADSRVSSCADGYWKDGTGSSDVCSACTGVADAAADATYTCTSARALMTPVAAVFLLFSYCLHPACTQPDAPCWRCRRAGGSSRPQWALARALARVP